ncbi:hypothetical protein GCM10020254_73640 [Streptomyces goshikiensis]
MDVFEYHPDNPDLLELSNHVRQSGSYYRDPAVAPRRLDRPQDQVRFELGRLVRGRQAGLRGPARGGPPLARLPHRQPVHLRRAVPPSPAPGVSEISYEVSGLRVYRP